MIPKKTETDSNKIPFRVGALFRVFYIQDSVSLFYTSARKLQLAVKERRISGGPSDHPIRKITFQQLSGRPAALELILQSDTKPSRVGSLLFCSAGGSWAPNDPNMKK